MLIKYSDLLYLADQGLRAALTAVCVAAAAAGSLLLREVHQLRDQLIHLRIRRHLRQHTTVKPADALHICYMAAAACGHPAASHHFPCHAFLEP